ncbi:MAG: hypothetical protein OHK0039_32210 [Bacteroidia bacterium]
MLLVVRTYQPTAPVRRNRPLADVQQEQTQRQSKRFTLGSGKLRVRKVVLIPAIILVVMIVLGLVRSYQANLTVRDIDVSLHNPDGHLLLDAMQIREALNLDGEDRLVGQPLALIDLRLLEEKLLALPTVRSAEVYHDMRGIVHMDIELRTPIARLVNNDGSHLYMDAEGRKFPVSRTHSLDVVLVRGDFDETAVDTFACSTIESTLPVLTYLRDQPFWNAQIAGIWLTQSGELVLEPEVGSAEIEFGYPIDIEDKFANLLDFYRQVLPETGWDRYRSLSVKYRGQVVARRR